MTTAANEPVDPLVVSDQPLDDQYSTNTSSTTDIAKDETKNVQAAATDATQQVAGTAQEQATKVVSDVRDQTRQLADETRNQLSSQAVDQRDRAVSGLRSLGDEFRGMADQSGQSGLGTQLAREGADISHKVADFIEQREPAQLLDEVRGYARRNPGTFLIGAAVAGVVVGRLTRGAMAARKDDGAETSSTLPGQRSAGLTAGYVGTQAEPTYVSDAQVPAYGSPQMDQLAYPSNDFSPPGTLPTEEEYRA